MAIRDSEDKQIKATILHIIPEERFGGPAKRTLEVARQLKEYGFVSIVAMPEGDKTFARLLNEADILYYQVKSFKRLPPNLSPFSLLNWFFNFIPGIVSLVRIIKRDKVDIVHTNGIMSLQAPLAAKLSMRKLVWHLNDIMTPRLLKSLLSPLVHLLPNRVVVSARAVAGYYLGSSNLARSATILYPPVDTTKFRPNCKSEKIRKEFGLKASDKVVGMVGNINPVKGYEYYFQAAGLIKESTFKVRFLVVGKRLETQEKYWQRLQRLIAHLRIEGDVILPGIRLDIPEIMDVMDIFVLSSVSEAAPIVVLEAMACAKPVIATKIGGVPELVIDGETGIIVPPKDAKAIANAVLYLLGHPDEAREMGIKARRRAIEYYDTEKIVLKYKELYESLMIQ